MPLAGGAETDRAAPEAGVELFAEMLSLPNDGRYPALDPDPARRGRSAVGSLGSSLG
jgi:hypothetical protein